MEHYILSSKEQFNRWKARGLTEVIKRDEEYIYFRVQCVNWTYLYFKYHYLLTDIIQNKNHIS